MKQILLPLLIICFFTSCRTNRYADRYYYVAEEPIELYEFPSFAGKSVATAAVGDTVSTTGVNRIQLGGPVPVEYKGYRFYAPNAKARFLSISKIKRSQSSVKPGITYAAHQQYGEPENDTAIATTNNASSLRNGFGLGFGFGTKRALQVEALYKRNRHMFRVGYAYQFSGQLGQLKGSRLSNYGTTVIGRSTYFVVVLAGYDFWLTNKWTIGIDGCYGSVGAYQNFSDKRFKAGGYHMISSSAPAYGYGGKVNFLATKLLMLSGGYNTLTGVNFTLCFVPYGYN